MKVVFGRAFVTRMLMSTSMVPSGIDLGVTLTPPSPVPETAVIVDWCVPAGEKTLDLAKHHVGISEEWQEYSARNFDVARSWDVRSQLPSILGRD